MFSTALHSRQPWSTILPNLDMTESTTLTTDLRLPGGISVLLIYHRDDSLEAVKRIDRSIQRGEDEDATFIVFLGSGIWDFQLLYSTLLLLVVSLKDNDVSLGVRRWDRLDSTFAEPVYLIPLSTLQELPRVLERLIRDFKTTTVAQAASKAKVRICSAFYVYTAGSNN